MSDKKSLQSVFGFLESSEAAYFIIGDCKERKEKKYKNLYNTLFLQHILPKCAAHVRKACRGSARHLGSMLLYIASLEKSYYYSVLHLFMCIFLRLFRCISMGGTTTPPIVCFVLCEKICIFLNLILTIYIFCGILYVSGTLLSIFVKGR